MRRSGADDRWGGVGHRPRIALLSLVFLIKGNDVRKHTILLADPMKFVRVEIFCRESSHPECRSSQMGKPIIKFEDVRLQLEDDFQGLANLILHNRMSVAA
jgi:hypothetical protein